MKAMDVTAVCSRGRTKLQMFEMKDAMVAAVESLLVFVGVDRGQKARSWDFTQVDRAERPLVHLLSNKTCDKQQSTPPCK